MTPHSEKTKSADVAILVFLAVSIASFWKYLVALVAFSLTHEYCSHVVLIPFISLWLIYVSRNSIRKTLSTWIYGVLFAVPAIPALLFAFSRKETLDPNDFLACTTFAVICVWISGFSICYGLRAFKAAIFPLLFLFLMIPLPTLILQATTHFLQQGSTDITYWLLQGVGQPSVKDGYLIHMPKLTIRVAEECSGIRSSLALFITCLLAGYMTLKSNWKRTIFVLLTFPVALIKNGIRIATIVLLSLHVDMRVMTSSLHRDGGFLFFIIALLIMFPFLKLLQKSEVAGSLRMSKNLRPAQVGSQN
jgi:exosortase